MNNFDFSLLPKSWHIVPEEDKKPLENELILEVGPEHELYGKECSLLARRFDMDDFLFYVNVNSGKLALVHLTFSGTQEKSKNYPFVVLYDNQQDFLESQASID